MRINFFGTYDINRPRNRVFINALRSSGVNVDECHFDLWRGVNDKFSIGKLRLIFIISAKRIFAYFFLLFRFLIQPVPDVIVVGYLGHFDVWLACALRIFYKIPVIFVMHLSLYETAALDRRMFKRNSFISMLLFNIDRLAMRLVDMVIVDTVADKEYFSRVFNIDPVKFSSIFIGALDGLLSFGVSSKNTEQNRFSVKTKEKVLFYGQFIPLQGVEHIIEAIELLQHREGLEFMIIGKGQKKPEIKKMAEMKSLKNIVWIDWVEYSDLARIIRMADIVLGVFGVSGKTRRVIPNKVFDCLACGKPLITADTEAMRSLVLHGESAYLCEAGNPCALADSITYLLEHKEIMAQIAEAGHEIFLKNCSTGRIGVDSFSKIKLCADNYAGCKKQLYRR